MSPAAPATLRSLMCGEICWKTAAHLRCTGAHLGMAQWPATEVDEVVAASRRLWAREGVNSPDEFLRSRGWPVSTRRLDAAVGGLQALLLPRREGGFAVVVDPDPTPEQIAAGLDGQAVRSWRVAHEYAHTFFYEPTVVPSRRRPASRAEELFCDRFACTVTGVWTWSAKPLGTGSVAVGHSAP